MSKDKEPFYTLTNILKHKADYNVIYGERSNGKTTAVLKYALEEHINSNYKNQLGIIRRYDEDFKGKNGPQMCENLINLGWVKDFTKGKYNSILYYSQRWFLVNYDSSGNKLAQEKTPFAMGFSITKEEHYKSTSYPNIKSILFDEFISRDGYLTDEFIKFQNLLSTLIRLRTDVKIFMCGNTINKFCPYFSEMGLTGVRKQEKGTIDIYNYGESTLKVAVEYSDFPSKKKESNKYFAFNNPKLKMITHGGWEIDIYPHLPRKYKPQDVAYKFYICFDEYILQCNIICVEGETFIYVHNKTTPIREDNENIVYQSTPDYRHNYRTNIFIPHHKIDRKILDLIKRDKIFYQDNEVGEIMNNYFKSCKIL